MPATAEANTSTRNTIQRALVLDAVRSMHNHPTPAEIYDAVRRDHDGISRATVYRNLNLLAEHGEIQCVRIPNGANRYDYYTKPHYHTVCSLCGRVEDADMPYQKGLESKVRDAHGFQITGHSVIIEGVCSMCQHSN